MSLELAKPSRLACSSLPVERFPIPKHQSRWVPDEYYEEVLPRLVRALATAAPVVVHLCSELPVAWSPRAAASWESLLRAAGARRVAFHFGAPWPKGWKSSGVTRTFEDLHPNPNPSPNLARGLEELRRDEDLRGPSPQP